MAICSCFVAGGGDMIKLLWWTGDGLCLIVELYVIETEYCGEPPHERDGTGFTLSKSLSRRSADINFRAEARESKAHGLAHLARQRSAQRYQSKCYELRVPRGQ